ncbi:hypothetical protein [Microbispora hainanensis]|uniref:Uncharacterized protein n=1 Tax=Microbispora hainanensis TaxID=568844 RepID=A0A544YXN6_9ACTN|nr:hypothetical protein [Microbispora hainanensis]TQS21511.1 hypothetical protein FLX08_11880 [Microbispora hainanensis]
MGIVGKASAISAGALAITLAGGLPLAASPAQAFDCTGGGGLVSGLTGGVCSLVDGVGQLADGVTDIADKATGGVTEPVTKAVDDTLKTTTGAAGTAVNDVGKAVDTAGRTLTGAADSATGAASGATGGADASAGATGAVSGVTEAVSGATEAVSGAAGKLTGGGATSSPSPTIQKLTDGLTRAVQDTCLPLVAGEECASDEGDEGAGSAGKAGTAGKKATRPKASMTPEGILSPEPYRPRLVAALEDASRTGRGGKVDPDEDGVIPLLWPGQKVPEMPELHGDHAGARTRAHRSYDTAGTALTAVLLLSALLATRVVSARRARAGQQEATESIPFEGGLRLPGKAGRHRLA